MDKKKKNKILTLVGQFSRSNWHHLSRQLAAENLSAKSIEILKQYVHIRGVSCLSPSFVLLMLNRVVR